MTAADSVAANGYWTSGTTQVNTADATYAANAKTALAAFAGGLDAMNWSIGLAASVQDLYNDFYDNGTESLTDSNGKTSATRALEYGSFGTGASREFAYYISVSSLPTSDALIGLLIGEGDSSGAARNAILSASDREVALVALPNSAGNKFMVDIYAAESFTDKAAVNAACGVTQNFGGGACDITGKSKDFFNALNSIRVNPSTTTNNLFKTQLTSWQSGATLANANSSAPVNLVTDGDGDGVNETYTMSEGKAAVDSAITTINSKSAQSPFAFNAGLYYSAKDWTDLVAGQSTSLSLATSGTTTNTRADKYGTVTTTLTQSFVAGNWDAVNAVVYLLVDDGNAGARLNQEAIFDATNTMIGVSHVSSTTYTDIYTVVYSGDYATDANVSCTSTGVTLAAGTLLQQGTEAAYAGLFVGTATIAAMMAALF